MKTMISRMGKQMAANSTKKNMFKDFIKANAYFSTSNESHPSI